MDMALKESSLWSGGVKLKGYKKVYESDIKRSYGRNGS